MKITNTTLTISVLAVLTTGCAGPKYRENQAPIPAPSFNTGKQRDCGVAMGMGGQLVGESPRMVHMKIYHDNLIQLFVRNVYPYSTPNISNHYERIGFEIDGKEAFTITNNHINGSQDGIMATLTDTQIAAMDAGKVLWLNLEHDTGLMIRRGPINMYKHREYIDYSCRVLWGREADSPSTQPPGD